IVALRDAGADVRISPCDLADLGARQAWIATLPALSGIVHAAGVLRDATLAQAEAAQFAAVLAVKLDTALDLDAAFPALNFLILFSSAVGLFGQAGQASHVAASLGLDALAARRRARGQHALSLGWGLWQDIGSASGNRVLIERMAEQGMAPIGLDMAEVVLAWALCAPDAAVTVLPIDRDRFMHSFASARPPAALRHWRQRVERRVAVPVLATSAILHAGLSDIVAAEAAAVLGYPAGKIPARTANLFELGLDSLMAVELRNRLQQHFSGRTLSSTLLFEHSSIDALAAHLGGETLAAAAPAAARATDEPIAVVGIGCRLAAGGSDPAAFWQALAEGRDGIIPKPERPDAAVAQGSARQAGYLPDVAGFDPTFFGSAPREAVFMDPQHRLVLEVAWEALEYALIRADQLSGSRTGVFLGMCNYDYAQFAAAVEGADGYAGTGGAPSIAAGRLAYLLGLTGPAMVIDTACSSSLVAAHLAVQALRAGECDMALAGGVNLMLGTGTTTALEQLHMLSPDGRCKAFDARA
ncbi:MAG TPA: beta-ketoacyl synthase N-terminal-like domain-containing protein, partial [Rhodopila sp.]|nr:beta-ketoacyl synthase N-terminal-like domain-containing protein [Rhodopila sp.]